jgi:hypothetical protein
MANNSEHFPDMVGIIRLIDDGNRLQSDINYSSNQPSWVKVKPTQLPQIARDI